MKKWTSMLLALTLCLGLMAGCGSTAQAPAVSEPEQTSVSEPETAPAQPVDEPEEPVAPEAEASAEEQEAPEEIPAEPVVYELPLTDEPATFDIFTTAAPGFMAVYLGEDGSYNTAEATRNFAEVTGITIDFIEVDMFSFNENFNLMIASGDYPDILTGVDGYAGGYTKAYDDDVILELTDYVLNDMPAYQQRLDAADAWKDTMNDEGQIFAVYSLNSEVIADRGPVMRMDWLEAMGMEAPTTYDQWYELGLAALNQYDIEYAYFFNSQLNPSITFSAGYDLPEMDISVVGSHFYQKEGKVQSALVSENLKDYLQMMRDWYAAGLISRDFFSTVGMEVKTAFADDACLGCWDNADFITEDNRNEELMAKGFHAVGVPVTLREEGQTLHFSLNVDGAAQGGICISTCCENPELVIKTMDFSFTDEGALLSNYGIEGISYEIGPDGAPQWTEAMTTAEDRTFRAALIPYIFTGMPTLVDVTKYWPETFDEDSYAALELWTNAANDGAYSMPSALNFTTEESEIYSSTIADIETYATEYMLSCITGANDLDSSWDAYVEKVWSLGLQDCIDAKQGAYERYLVRGNA